MARILLKTSIPYTEGDWHIGRFSVLAQHLRADGHDRWLRGELH
jgi:methionyl-tRNA synthetase